MEKLKIKKMSITTKFCQIPVAEDMEESGFKGKINALRNDNDENRSVNDDSDR